MQIEKSALLSAIKKVMPGIVKGKNTLAGADTIIFGDGALHTFNGTICASVKIDTEGISGAIIGEKFFKLVQSFKSNDITLETSEKGLVIKCGRNKSTLSWITEIATPEYVTELHNINPSIELPADFQEALQLCEISDNAKESYAGTIFDDNHVYSTDAMRSNIYTFETPLLDDDGEIANFWISLQNTSQLLKLDEKFTHYTKCHTNSDGEVEKDVWVHFKTTEGTIFSCTLLAIEPSKQVVPFLQNFASLEKKEDSVAGTLPIGFPDAIKRVGIMSAKSSGKDGNASLYFVKLSFTEKHLMISSQSKDSTSEEALDWPTDGIKIKEGFSCLYPTDFLHDIYTKSKDFWVTEIQGGEGPVTVLLFEAEHYRHLICNLSDPE
jgi:hypothetical protein